jgi:chemotaxis protein CheD
MTAASGGQGQVTMTGIGALSVAQGEGTLIAQGLGSCIGIAAYEPLRRIAVLAHVMLPGPAPAGLSPDQRARHAPEAVAALVDVVEGRGGARGLLVVKIAGGAQVIRLAGREDRFQVGRRNVEAVRAALATHGLRVAAADTGGNAGRTLALAAATGAVTVRPVSGAERAL